MILLYDIIEKVSTKDLENYQIIIFLNLENEKHFIILQIKI